jgi:hypothetical protein
MPHNGCYAVYGCRVSHVLSRFGRDDPIRKSRTGQACPYGGLEADSSRTTSRRVKAPSWVMDRDQPYVFAQQPQGKTAGGVLGLSQRLETIS